MKDKEKFCYIFSIGFLIFLLAIVLFLAFSGIFISSPTYQVSNLPLGGKSVISIKENQGEVLSFDLTGSLLPGENIPQNINIMNTSSNNLYLRAKSFIITNDNGKIDMNLQTTENWIYNEDGYYYFIGEIIPNASIGLSTKIIVNKDYNFSKNQRYIVNIIVESLSTNLEKDNIWN